MKGLLYALLAGSVATLCLTLLIRPLKRAIIFQPIRGLTPAPGQRWRKGNVWILLQRRRVNICFWHLPAVKVNENDPRSLIIFCHGNGGNMNYCQAFIQQPWIPKRNCHLLFFDYPGYGESGGQPSEEALQQSARAIWKHARYHLGFLPEEIVVFGHSLGTSVAVYLATHEPVFRLILQNGFARISHLSPTILAPMVSEFDTVGMIQQRSLTVGALCRVLLIHSVSDRLIPHREMGILHQEFAQTTPHVKSMSVGGSHNHPILSVDQIFYLRAFIANSAKSQDELDEEHQQ